MNYFLRHDRRTLSKDMSLPKPHEVGDYVLTQTIGQGSSGLVKLGIHKKTSERVAVKLISRQRLGASCEAARAVERELAVLQLLYHPYLVDLLQVLQDNDYVYFVMEYIEGGELYQVLRRRGRLPEAEARHFFGQLSSAMAWCHAHHICHRDVKPENILIDTSTKSLKVADFGMAAIQPPASLLRTSCGSPHYASPEIIKGKPYDGNATDVWSCGVILYALLSGRLPFEDRRMGHLLSKIKTGRFRRLPDDVSAAPRDLLHRMLIVDPVERITMEQVVAHPWLRPPNEPILHTMPIVYPNLTIDPMEGPAISNLSDLDGPIWETLKVLWRELGSTDRILDALTHHSPNAQKLTYRLLQRRAARHRQHHERMQDTSTDSTLVTYQDWKQDRDDSRYKFSNIVDRLDTPSSMASSGEMHARHVFQPLRRFSYWTVASPAPSCVSLATEGDDRYFSTADSAFSLSLSRSIRHTAPAPLPNAIVTLRRLQPSVHHLLSSGRWQRTLSRWLSHARTWCNTISERLAWISTSRSLVFDCRAKHECEAAGKVHQVLNEHFHGRLRGCRFPNGRIQWTGSMALPSHRYHHLTFICYTTRIPNYHGRVRIQFVLLKGDPSRMRSAMNELLNMLNMYEEEARAVSEANGWISV